MTRSVPSMATLAGLLGCLLASISVALPRMAMAGERTVARERAFSLDLRRLDPRFAGAAMELGAELFDQHRVTIDRSRVEQRGPGSYTWFGRVRGHAHGDMVLTVVDGQVAGTLVVADEAAHGFSTYQFVSTSGDVPVLRKIESAGFPPDHPPGADALAPARRQRVPPASAPDRGTSVTAAVARKVAYANPIIDVMILYSNQVANSVPRSIDVEIQHAVDRTNAALANSGVAARLRLVHFQQLNYDESGDFVTDLEAVTNRGSDYVDDISNLRERHGADVVSLFVENDAYCGVGWLDADANHAFSVVNRACAAGNLSLAHELGHNLGARHDPDADSATTPYAHGHGYAYPPDRWRTVMAVDAACARFAVSCTRVAYFSSPDLDLGTPAVAMGTASTSDVARLIDERASAIAAFRQAGVASIPFSCVAAPNRTWLPGGGGTIVVAASCANDADVDTWSWTRNASALDGIGPMISDTLPPVPVSGVYAVTYAYAVTACNFNGCAPTASADVVVFGTPVATTGTAIDVTDSGATLDGSVSSGWEALAWFEYGMTASYDGYASAAPLTAGASDVDRTAVVSGLRCGTLYHFRLVSENLIGPAVGDDATFTTAACTESTANSAGASRYPRNALAGSGRLHARLAPSSP